MSETNPDRVEAGYYVYCLVEAAEAPATEGVESLPGLGEPRVEALTENLWIVGSNVDDRQAYSEAAIHDGLEDLDWVSGRALAHEGVIERCTNQGSVLPLKLLTLFVDRETALERLGRRLVELRAVFERIRGRAEWGVQIHVAPEEAASKPENVDPPSSGRAFLQRKLTRREAKRDRREALAEEGARLLENLADLADETLDRGAGTPGGTLVLDLVLLVPRSRIEELQRRLADARERLGELGGRFVSTGPWAPYHFVEPTGEGPA